MAWSVGHAYQDFISSKCFARMGKLPKKFSSPFQSFGFGYGTIGSFFASGFGFLLFYEIFYIITQWSCSASGSLREMPDSNLGPLPQKSGSLPMSHHISLVPCIYLQTLNAKILSCSNAKLVKMLQRLAKINSVFWQLRYFSFLEGTKLQK